MESDKREESAAPAAGAGSEPATGHGQGAGHVHGPGCSHGHDFDPLLHDPNHLLGRQPVYRTDPKIGRNDPCPCGSGKKYKKCHGT